MGKLVSVCFVDDEEGLNQVYSAKLSNYYLVRTFTSAELAVEEIKKGYRPDVIVTDLKIPEFSGMHFLKFLEGMNLKMPVIVISGFIEPSELKELLQHKVVGVLEKPFMFDELREKIDLAIQKSLVETGKTLPDGR